MWSVFIIIAGVFVDSPNAEFPVPEKDKEANRTYWLQLGNSTIQNKLARQPITNRAQSVVLFLGDGMGVSTVTAARIFKGQSKYNHSGEESCLSWEAFPHVSLSKTYGLDTQTSDSANTATAYLCGVKANTGTIGVDSRVKGKQCHNDTSAYVSSIMQWAQEAGMWTGIVTTTEITDASPAASYAHSGYRSWKYEVPEGCNASDIAKQLIHNSPGKGMRVILGGGRRAFLPSNETDEEGKNGSRKDGLNLIAEWTEMKRNFRAAYVWNRSELLAVDTNCTDYLLGLFDTYHMPYWVNRSQPNSAKPNLTEMVTAALGILTRAPRGFALLVEGGRIDHAHHENRAKLALQETLEFDEAVNATAQILPEDKTLIVVTADHSHMMSIAGHPSRGTNILGNAGYTTKANRTYTYTVLSYAVGPGGSKDLTNYTEAETSSDDFLQQATFYRWLATHGGEDVAVYARGPWAHLFDGVNDQTYIAHVMAYAACIGQFNGSESLCRRA